MLLDENLDEHGKSQILMRYLIYYKITSDGNIY